MTSTIVIAIAGSCAAPTEVTVEVFSEVECAHHATVGIVGASDPSALPSGTLVATSAHCDETKRAGSVVIQPSGDRDDSFYLQVMTRDDSQSPESCTPESHYAGCIVARRRVRFAPHETLSVRVDLRLQCLGVDCNDPFTTCVRGQCLPAFVPSECAAPCDETQLVDATGASNGPLPNVEAGSASDGGPSDAASDRVDDATTPDVLQDASPFDGAPLPLPTGADIVAGFDFNCAINTQGTVSCWGNNLSGETGLVPTSTRQTTRRNVPLPSAAVQVAAGAAHTCALMQDGHVMCWGDNSFGQVDPSTDGGAFTPIAGPALKAPAKYIAAGGYHTCAVLTTDSVQCWGLNTSGELGTGDFAQPQGAGDIVGFVGVVPSRLFLGHDFSCALLTGQSVQCWGKNDKGQLGNGATSTFPSPSPQPIPGLSGVVTGTSGTWHTCVKDNSDALLCWGFNGSGQIIANGAAEYASPVAIAILGSVTGIAAGKNHMCIVSNGTPTCWGDNTNGQVTASPTGPQTTQSTVAVTVPNLVRAAAGRIHTCAIAIDGTAVCWGDNSYGQLGDPQTSFTGPSVVPP